MKAGAGWAAWPCVRCGSREGARGPVRRKENGSGQWNSGIFDLFKRISKGNDLIRLKDGLPEF
jgi:hypothetical protein